MFQAMIAETTSGASMKARSYQVGPARSSVISSSPRNHTAGGCSNHDSAKNAAMPARLPPMSKA